MCGNRHRAEQNKRYDAEQHNQQSAGFYHSTQWQKFRRWFIAKHPLCEECRKHGRTERTRHVHHVEPVEARPDLALVEDNCRALCGPCHNQLEPRAATRA